MVDYDDILDDSHTSSLYLILYIVVFVGLFAFTLSNLDSFKRQKVQENFQQALTRALVGYSTTYEESIDNYSNIAEGYILMEDITIYSKASNSLALNRNNASDIFFRCLDASSKLDVVQLKSFGTFIVDVISKVSDTGDFLYSVAIYRNGNTLMAIKEDINSLNGVEAFIQDSLDVTLDIATGFNSSLRKAQEYAENRVVNNQQVFTNFTTSMAILKDVPVYGIFGKTYEDIYELQTYSLGRKES